MNIENEIGKSLHLWVDRKKVLCDKFTYNVSRAIIVGTLILHQTGDEHPLKSYMDRYGTHLSTKLPPMDIVIIKPSKEKDKWFYIVLKNATFTHESYYVTSNLIESIELGYFCENILPWTLVSDTELLAISQKYNLEDFPNIPLTDPLSN